MSRNNIITSPLSRCVAEVTAMLESYPRVTVCVDRDGDLIVGGANSERMTAYVARHPKDKIADYNRRAHAFEVLQDLAERAGEMASYGIDRVMARQI